MSSTIVAIQFVSQSPSSQNLIVRPGPWSSYQFQIVWFDQVITVSTSDHVKVAGSVWAYPYYLVHFIEHCVCHNSYLFDYLQSIYTKSLQKSRYHPWMGQVSCISRPVYVVALDSVTRKGFNRTPNQLKTTTFK